MKSKIGVLLSGILSLCMTAAMAETADYLKPINIWDPAIHARLFGDGRTLACPNPQTVTNAAWEFEGEQETWPMSYIDTNAVNFRIEHGVAKFTAGAKTVRFGWGNYRFGDHKSYPPLTIKGDFASTASVQIRLKQSQPGSNTVLTIDFRYHGDPLDAGTWADEYSAASGRPGPESLIPSAQERTVVTDGWQVVTANFHAVSEADGIGMEIATQPGNEIEIDWIRLININANIYARKVINLPSTPVFSAKAKVSASLSVWINSHLVRAGTPGWGQSRYNYVGVDLKPYLKPGTNVLGLVEISRFISTPVCWMAGAIQLDSGATIKIGTDLTWKLSHNEAPGWLDEKFDDAQWLAPGDKDPTGYLGKEMRPYTSYTPARLPVYCGQVELAHPEAAKFFYDQDQPMRFSVRLPIGLASSNPIIEYTVWNDRTGRQVCAGKTNPGVPKEEALCYSIDPENKLERGVYTIVLDAAGGKNPELHRQEIFVVTGKIPMPETDGKSWDDGMKVVLVDSVDCADQNEKHPFADAALYNTNLASRIVNRNGLTYREAPTNSSPETSWMSWTISFKTIGQPHYIELEYPDDAARLLEVQIHPLHWRQDKYIGPYSQETAWTAAGVQTGGRYPNTGKFQKLRFIVWAHEPKANIMIAKLNPAVSKIRVYEIDQLPALITKPYPDGRRFGLMTERASVMERTFSGSASMHPLQRNPYLSWFDEAEKYAQYCRFTGQNAYFIGSYQYAYGNGPTVELDTGAEGCSLIPDLRDVYINVLGANGIMSYSAVEYRTDQRDWEKGWISLHEALAGKDFMFQVDKNGIYQGGNNQRDNPMASPIAFESFRKNMMHIANRFSPYPAWKGLVLILAPVWEGPCYDDATVSFDDQTIRLFEKETGLKIPVTDTTTLRFGKRYDWIMANAREKWFDWRSAKVVELHEKMAAMCREKRHDLEYSVVFEIFDKDKQYLDAYANKPSFHRSFRDSGYDLRAFRKCRGVSIGRDFWAWDDANGGGGIGSWDYARNPELVALLNDNGGEHRTAFVRTGFDEWTIQSLVGDRKPKWFGGYWVGHVFPAHQYLAERFVSQLIDNDIDTFEYGFCDSLQPSGGEQELRAFIRPFVSLPRERFETLAGRGLDRNICVKQCRGGTKEYLLVINPAWWETSVKIELDSWKPVIRTTDGARVWPNWKKILKVKLSGYGVVCFERERTLKALSAEAIPSRAADEFLSEKLGEYRKELNDAGRGKFPAESLLAPAEKILAEAQVDYDKGDLTGCWNALSAWPLYRVVCPQKR